MYFYTLAMNIQRANELEKNPFTIANNGVKYLGIKETHNLYAQNYETLLSKLKTEIKFKISCAWIGRLN